MLLSPSHPGIVAVTGIGGVFFRAKHPDALTKWYRTHFAVTMEG